MKTHFCKVFHTYHQANDEAINLLCLNSCARTANLAFNANSRAILTLNSNAFTNTNSNSADLHLANVGGGGKSRLSSANHSLNFKFPFYIQHLTFLPKNVLQFLIITKIYTKFNPFYIFISNFYSKINKFQRKGGYYERT